MRPSVVAGLSVPRRASECIRGALTCLFNVPRRVITSRSAQCPKPSYGRSTLWGEVMHNLGAMLAALVATILLAPTASAFDCHPDDVADCVRSILKVPPVHPKAPGSTEGRV